MDPEKKEIELIEAYLDEKLGEGDLLEFEDRQKNDPEFRKRVNAQKLLREGIKGVEMLQFLQEAQKWEKRGKNKEGEISYALLFAIAASILILLMIAAVWYANANYSNSELVEQSLVINDFIPAFPEQVSRSGVSTSIEEDSLILKIKNSCDKAFEHVGKISTTHPNYLTVQYFVGQCFLKQQEYQEALPYLQIVADNLEEVETYSGSAWWYYVLAKIGAGAKDEEIKDLLNEVPPNAPPGLRQRANSLINSLNSTWRNLVL